MAREDLRQTHAALPIAGDPLAPSTDCIQAYLWDVAVPGVPPGCPVTPMRACGGPATWASLSNGSVPTHGEEDGGADSAHLSMTAQTRALTESHHGHTPLIRW